MQVHIEILSEPDELGLRALNSLLGQLSTDARPLSLEDLIDISADRQTTVLVARADEQIVGCAIVVTVKIFTGTRSILEDVVVGESHRRRGIGSLLIESAVAIAKAAGSVDLDLTSRPMRAEANRLYASLGFIKRETNVYRYSFE